MRALNDPCHHGSRWHIGSEVWVSFVLGFLDHYLHHHSHHIVTCFDLPFLRWVVRHCHTLLHLFPNLFLHFLCLHSLFVSSLFIFSYPPRSSSRFMNDECFGACHLLFDLFIYLDTWLSHLTHMVLWYLTLRTQGFGTIYLEIWAFVSHRFIHILPLAYITVRVVRPPWGHEVSCLLRCSSFEQASSTNWVWDVDRSPLLRGGIEGHILSFHSVYLPQARDQRQMIQRVGTIEGTFTQCFDMFILGHTLILACWLRLLHMYAGNPFRLEMFWALEFE